MIVSRITTRLGKPMSSAVTSWYSSLAPISYTPCRAVTTGRDYMRLRPEGAESASQNISLLDPFLGKWLQVGTENHQAFLAATAIPPQGHARFLNMKMHMTYSRYRDIWTVESGQVNDDFLTRTVFRLGKTYIHIYGGGRTSEMIIYQDGKLLKEKYTNMDGAGSVRNIVGEVTDDTLTRTITARGVTMKRIFQRQ